MHSTWIILIEKLSGVYQTTRPLLAHKIFVLTWIDIIEIEKFLISELELIKHLESNEGGDIDDYRDLGEETSVPAMFSNNLHVLILLSEF